MKINLILAGIFLSIIICANVDELHGIVGLTKKHGGLGCLCHDLNPVDSVMVWIEGPDSVFFGDSAQYKLYMTGGPSAAGGFNIAAYYGGIDSVDSFTKIMFGELTHSEPKLFSNDTVFWDFVYIAPDSLVTDTIYSVANSVNLDTIPSDLDQWNFGENFAVAVIDEPVDVEDLVIQPDNFILYQNYPNPFNPSTIIKFRISTSGFVSLKVYDILGNEIATLVNKVLSPGNYEAEFNPELIGFKLSSGIYLYQLQSVNMAQTKKMVLIN